MRYFLYISYKGTNFHGWQIQDNALTVQQELEEGLAKICRQPVSTMGSGRTDTGVHAAMQVVHFDLPDDYDISKLIYKLNGILSPDISVNDIKKVKPDVSTRFDAISRQYHYRINPKKNPFYRGLSYSFSRPLDIEKMNGACEILKSWEDFECFSKVKTEVKNFNCQIVEAKWFWDNDQLVFSVTANRFLRGMVRAMVGTLLEIGQGKMDLAQLKEILESRDRKKAGRSVPADGLYLQHIEYPTDIFID